MREGESNGRHSSREGAASTPAPATGGPCLECGENHGGSANGGLPADVDHLAEACVRYVEQATGVRLDYEAETLPVLDHYLASRRADLRGQPEAQNLILRAVGAYFGEVFRRRVGGFWRVEDDPIHWEVCAEPVYLSFCPFAVAYDALYFGDDGGPTSKIQLDDEDRDLVDARLAELPAVSEEEFYQLATRLEVLDIAVDAVKNRMIEAGLGNVAFGLDDYKT